MKNRVELTENWKQIKGKLKNKYEFLTENDLLLVEGKQEELLDRLQHKLDKTEEEIYKIISEL